MELWNTVPSEWKNDETSSGIACIKCFRDCQCSLIKYRSYKPPPGRKYATNRKKAGVLMTTNKNKILIVQSRGRLWGVPKGGVEEGETDQECAFRELGEETGVHLDATSTPITYEIRMNNGRYFCVDASQEHPVLLDDIHDSTGVGWISIECLKYFISQKLINVTADFSRILQSLN
jgi:8-oxo-dGTP pyrophosphatase MutT (NUDIX family)